MFGADDLSDMIPSRPTLSEDVPSSSSLAVLEEKHFREEEFEGNTLRRRSSCSDVRLEALLSPGLITPNPLKRPLSASEVLSQRYLQDFYALRCIFLQITGLMEADVLADIVKKMPKSIRLDDMPL